MTTAVNTQPAPVPKLLVAGLITTVVAVVGNVIAFALASALNTLPDDVLVLDSGEPMTLFPIVMATIIGNLAAIVVYAIIQRRAANPERLYRRVALIALVLSFTNPFAIQGGDAAFYGTLLLMHTIAALPAIFLLPRLANR